MIKYKREHRALGKLLYNRLLSLKEDMYNQYGYDSSNLIHIEFKKPKNRAIIELVNLSRRILVKGIVPSNLVHIDSVTLQEMVNILCGDNLNDLRANDENIINLVVMIKFQLAENNF